MIKKRKKTAEQKKWEKENPEGKAIFSWTLDDYKIWEIEPPECIVKNSGETEGELLSENEIKNWHADSFQTLIILKGEDRKVYKKVYEDFVLDLKYLLSLNKISFDVLEFVLDENNFG